MKGAAMIAAAILSLSAGASPGAAAGTVAAPAAIVKGHSVVHPASGLTVTVP